LSDTNTKKSEEHTSRIIPLIIGLATTFVGAPTVINIISDIFFTPNISMSFLVDPATKNNITLEIKNSGNKAATHYLLTVESPFKVSNYNLFITENSTDLKISLSDQKIMQISLPRLVQGAGSLIRLDLQVNSPSNLTTGKMIAYSTFDQGSSKAEFSFVEDKKPRPFYDQLNENLGNYLSNISILGIISTIVTFLIGYFGLSIYKKQQKISKTKIKQNPKRKPSNV
jgi:hypothetical protein